MAEHTPTPHEPEERALLVVAAWPKSMSEHQRSVAIEAATGEPRALCDGLARRNTPAVLMAGPRSRVRQAAHGLRSLKVPAMYPSRSDLAAIMPPFVTRRLTKAEGAPFPLFMCEPLTKRGEGRGLDLRSVRLIVKGRVKRFTVTTVLGGTGGSFFGDAAYDGEEPGYFDGTRATSRTGMLGDVLDLWTDEGPPIRIDGRQFDFSILGNQRKLTDGENMTALALYLGEQASGARIELGFSDFAPMVAMSVRTVLSLHSSVRREDEGPAFDLFSCITALVERAMRPRSA